MHFVTFESDEPLSHLQRALDELGRAGFDLMGLHLSRPEHRGQDTPLIRIDYCGDTSVSPSTYVARIARMQGAMAVQGGTLMEGGMTAACG